MLKQEKSQVMQIIVETADGKKMQFQVEAADTIMRVKAKIQVKQGIPLDQQNLNFEGQRLEDNRTLADYNVEDGSTLILKIGLSMQIFVKAETGRRIDLKVLPEDTIASIKSRV